jgi:hypothetical protein
VYHDLTIFASDTKTLGPAAFADIRVIASGTEPSLSPSNIAQDNSASKYLAKSISYDSQSCGEYSREFGTYLDENFPSAYGSRTWLVYHFTATDGEGCGYEVLFEANNAATSTEINAFAKHLRDYSLAGATPEVQRYLSYIVHASLDTGYFERSKPENGFRRIAHWPRTMSFDSYFGFQAWQEEAIKAFAAKDTFLDFVATYIGLEHSRSAERVFPESNLILLELQGSLIGSDGSIIYSSLARTMSPPLGRDCSKFSSTGFCW